MIPVMARAAGAEVLSVVRTVSRRLTSTKREVTVVPPIEIRPSERLPDHSSVILVNFGEMEALRKAAVVCSKQGVVHVPTLRTMDYSDINQIKKDAEFFAKLGAKRVTIVRGEDLGEYGATTKKREVIFPLQAIGAIKEVMPELEIRVPIYPDPDFLARQERSLEVAKQKRDAGATQFATGGFRCAKKLENYLNWLVSSPDNPELSQIQVGIVRGLPLKEFHEIRTVLNRYQGVSYYLRANDRMLSHTDVMRMTHQ